MRILYGVQATGNGHISRARALLPALKAAGIETDFLFSGRPKAELFDMDMFGDYRHCRGFTFSTEQGQVRKWRTVMQNRPLRFLRDIRALDVRKYDLVLTDFEPVSAWAAKMQGVASVGLAHQYALRYSLPGTERALWLAAAIKAFAPADKMLGIHWQSFGQPILPPMLPAEQLSPAYQPEEPFILVYLPFESLHVVRDCLLQLPEQQFRVYAAVPQSKRWHNVEVLPLCRIGFPQDLARCSGVISNAGFGMGSEAMLQGKKLLLKPLQGQIEQFSNARILEKMQRAEIMKKLDTATIRRWAVFPAKQAVQYPNVASAVAAWLAGGCLQPETELAASLWQHTQGLQ